MKRNLIILLLLIVSCSTTIARPISMKRMGLALQHGSMRMPSATQVSADYDNDIITINISAYTGNVQVYVYDSNGSVVAYDCSSISGSGTLNIDVNSLEGGNYSLYIVLGSVTYYGEFQV